MTTGPAGGFASTGIENHPGHGSQKSHGRKGGGGPDPRVRESLAKAGSTSQIAAATRAEAKRITGRDIDVDFEGSDPQIAREHAEGVLRGLERFPDAPLERVMMEPPPSWVPPGGDPKGAMAFSTGPVTPGQTMPGPQTETTIISFASTWSSSPDAYRAAIDAKNEKTLTSPVDVGIHEMGHVVAFGAGAESSAYKVVGRERRRLAGEGEKISTKQLVQREVSTYATTHEQEFVAEAFTDVMVNGSDASKLSQDAFAVIESAYTAGGGK